MAFLTELDSRAAVKGSRDALGAQAVWTQLGRHVVGNLTTASTSLVDFTVLLLGFSFIEKLEEMGASEEAAPAFLKWEQVASYARSVKGDKGFRGTTRVSAFRSEGGKVSISADRSSQILSNQKAYGLFGLYAQPARASHLLDPKAPRLTDVAREVVEESLYPFLGTGGLRRLVDIVQRKESRLDFEASEDKKLLADVALAIGMGRKRGRKEKELFRTHVLEGGPGDVHRTKGLQREFAEVMRPTLANTDFRFSPSTLNALSRHSERAGHVQLAARIDRIRVCESVMAPAACVFDLLLNRDGASVEEVADQLRRQWAKAPARFVVARSFREIEDDLSKALGGESGSGPKFASAWVSVGEALEAADYESLVHHLLALNTLVMWRRSGAAPWIEITDGKLDVQFRDDTEGLPAKEDLAELWRFPYFLNALRTVAARLEVE